MTELGPLLLLGVALSCSADNLAVDMAYGAGDMEVPFGTNVLVAVVTGAGTWLAVAGGGHLASWIDPSWAKWTGGGDRGVGITQSLRRGGPSGAAEAKSLARDLIRTPRTYWRKVLHVLDNPFAADEDSSGHVGIREGALLAAALSLDNAPNGLAAGLLTLGPALVAWTVFAVSILTLWLGVWVGKRFAFRDLGRVGGAAAGAALIAIGAYELLV